MNSEQFVNIIRSASLSEADHAELDQLVTEYPWFALPRYLKLKAANQLGLKTAEEETRETVVFSSNREHLYKWINGEAGSLIETSRLLHSELEFLDEHSDAEDPEVEEDAFTLMDDHIEDHGDDADVQAIPEKEETEMEEPETEEPVALPVMDPLDENDDESDGLHEESPDQTIAKEKESAPAENDEETVLSEDPAGTASEKEVQQQSETNSEENGSPNLIERFLKNEPGVIKADKETNLEGDISEGSVQEDDSYITDTLAKIYVKQGLHAKAIYAYERLSLKYPEKSAYFAAQIEKIKNITNV